MKINYNIKDFLSSLIFYLAILLFIIGFNFTDSPPPFGWYQQFMPNLNNQPISDIFFLDSLTGWAVTNDNMPQDTGYILKTINGGDNWTIKYRDKRDFGRIKFINSNTGFACGGTGSGTAYLFKSTNGGDNWFTLPVLGNNFYTDMSVLNNDTLWLVDPDGLLGGVFNTTNGGVNWVQQDSLGSGHPDHIYMFNGRIGFVAKVNNYTRKTTDGGQNWFPITNGSGEGFYDMYFADSLTGWGAFYNMRKTTNGGINWVAQTLPYGGNIVGSGIMKFSNINYDTLWGVGGIYYTPTGFRGMLYRTTNGGSNWLFQIPDTSIHISQYYYCKFINKLNGWAYFIGNTGIHTVTGGDTNFVSGIKNISSSIPIKFILEQNYPNPFNPRTVIPYSLKSPAYVRLIAYDITGREVQKLVDQKQQAGDYEVDFMGKFVSSGVYLYRMQVTNDKENTTYSDTKKMILIK
jgi:photosystem II stability/assembly factor-like uncharacterized protein